MRVLVFFDLPTATSENRKGYRKFRKFLITNGFIMMQESVYCKLCLNGTNVKTIVKNIKNNRPSSGLVQVLTITEKQYRKTESIVGKIYTDILNTGDRTVMI